MIIIPWGTLRRGLFGKR